MIIKIVTLFPSMFDGFINESIIKRAIEKEVVSIECINLRDYSKNKHHKVDDTPYGGGCGMVLSCEVVYDCLQDIKSANSHVILLTPQGTKYEQKEAHRLTVYEEIILICGHYEGFDERIRYMVDEEISIGDYVLTGGEIPAMAISDSVIRLLDGAITFDSHAGDSFSNGLLEYPQYTRPAKFLNYEVPEVLVNGNHKLISKFRHEQSLRRTYLKRPDLLANYELSDEDEKIIENIKREKLQ